MNTRDYDVRELADLAGVTPRTVHFYLQQGLLRSPGVVGPGAKYGGGHLARLRAIKLLQREHLPLAEIRRRLRPLSDEDVEKLVEQLGTSEPSPRRSALQYVQDLVGRSRTIATEALDDTSRTQGAGALCEPWERSQWERTVLAEGVELNVCRPLTREQNRRLERLIAAAREIFEKE